MSTAETRAFALSLHSFLRDLDPVRFRLAGSDAMAARMAALALELERIRERASQAMKSTSTFQHLDEVRALLIQSRPQVLHQWMAFRTRLLPVYEKLSLALAASSIHVPSLRPTNYKRNAFHVVCGAGALFLAEMFPDHLLLLAAPWALLGWFLEIGRRRSTRLNDLCMRVLGGVAHPHETHRVNSATWFVSALTVLALFFDVVPAAIGLLVLAIGDPVAALVGRRFGRIEITHGRTLEGSFAFLCSAAFGVFLLLTGLHELPITIALLVAASAAFAGALVELLSLRVDDNFSVPVVSGFVAHLLLGALAV